MFARYDSKGKVKRNRVCIDCQAKIESGEEEIIVEQHHKAEVNINNIVKRHGMDIIQKTALLNSPNMQWDDVTGNDFQEAMFKVTKAQQTFEQLPSDLRKQFDHNPAKFLDFVQNPENKEKLYDMGLAIKPDEVKPQKVEVVNNDSSIKANDQGVSSQTTPGEN